MDENGSFVGELLENRNMLTTNAIARLLHSIVGGVAVSTGAIADNDGFTQTSSQRFTH